MEKEKPSTLKNVLFLGAILLVLSLYFKNKFSSDDPPADPKEEQVVEAEPIENPTDKDIVSKLNVATECLNSHSDRIFDSYYRYLSWADKKTGPTGKEQNIYGLYSLYDYKRDAEAMETSRTIAPGYLSELDSAGITYIQALIQINDLVATAYRYYEHEDYRDDNFAKAKEYHQPLISAFDAFAAADLQLRNQILDQQNGLLHRSLAAASQAGDSAYLLQTQVMMLAQDLMDAGTVKEPQDVNLGKFTTLLDSFNHRLDIYRAFALRKQAESPSADVNSFLDETDDYLKKAKDLMRRVRDKKGYEMGDTWNNNPLSGWMISGSPFELLDGYEDVAEKYNRLVQYEDTRPRFLTGTLFHVRGPK
ncbi:MAG: DUF3829 domain-containing protein [Bacteroidia bacterium]